MIEDTISVMEVSLSIRAKSQLFCMLFTTMQNKVTDSKFVSAELRTHLRDQDTILVNELLRLERIFWVKLLTSLGWRRIRWR